MDDIRPPIPPGSGRLIDQLRRTIRSRGLSYESEKTYVHWALRYIRFHSMRHPRDMHERHVEAFLENLANRSCSVATQRLALNAIVFLYQKHLDIRLGELELSATPGGSGACPVSSTHHEATSVLSHSSRAHIG